MFARCRGGWNTCLIGRRPLTALIATTLWSATAAGLIPNHFSASLLRTNSGMLEDDLRGIARLPRGFYGGLGAIR